MRTMSYMHSDCEAGFLDDFSEGDKNFKNVEIRNPTDDDYTQSAVAFRSYDLMHNKKRNVADNIAPKFLRLWYWLG